MRPTIARAIGTMAILALFAGVSVAGASTKFDSTETIQFPGGRLVVTFVEGGQKRFSSVDYQLSATAVVTSCQTVGDVTQCGAALSFPTTTVTGLIPDDKGRVTGSLTVVGTPVGGTICTCISHVDYSEIVLTNLTSGRVYRLEPISADSP
jgi:hypothetical protein